MWHARCDGFSGLQQLWGTFDFIMGMPAVDIQGYMQPVDTNTT